MTAALLLVALAPALALGTSGQLTRTAQRAARDLWLVAVVLLVAAQLEFWSALMLVAALGRVLDTRPGSDPLDGLPWLLCWAAVGATWVLVRAQSPADWSWSVVLAVWGAGAWLLAGVMVAQRLRGRRPAGWLGQRAVAGVALALVLPLLPLWAWPGPLVGLWLSGPSWLAVLGLLTGICVRWPGLTPWIGAGLVGLVGLVLATRRSTWLESTPRGHSLDSVRMRVQILRLATRAFLTAGPVVWLGGFGPGTAGPAVERWALRYDGVEALGNFHNEPAQFVYEYGLVGAVALGAFAWRVAPHLTLGDPWSAAAVTGLVCAGGLHVAHLAPLGLLWLCILARVTL